MLEHELQEPPAIPIPAAERRVSAEELTRAVSALEDAKAAERIAGVAPIGQVVDELGLDATPEEIWAQVEKQRAQKAAEEQAKQMSSVVTPHAAIFQTPPHPSRPRRRWRWWAIAGIVWAAWYFQSDFRAMYSSSGQGPSVISSEQTIIISGDGQKQTINAQGKDVAIGGDGNKITLLGRPNSVVITGTKNTLRGEEPEQIEMTGDGNDVKWTDAK